jgi:hypothetical protein
MKARSGLAAGAVILALAAAGCGSGGPGTSSAGRSTLPSWAAGLGPSVTLESPTVNPAAGTPEATVKAYVAALTSGTNPASVCAYIIPASQPSCESSISKAAQQGQSITYSYKSFGLGYTAIDGTRALVGTTYTQFCVQALSRSCAPDITDPKIVFGSGQSFATLWTQVQRAGSSGSFSPVPCVVINGKWYVDAPSS